MPERAALANPEGIAGHLPRTGESFMHRNAKFEVVDMDGMRVDKVLVRLEPALDG